jgi:hypothetical protein
VIDGLKGGEEANGTLDRLSKRLAAAKPDAALPSRKAASGFRPLAASLHCPKPDAHMRELRPPQGLRRSACVSIASWIVFVFQSLSCGSE